MAKHIAQPHDAEAVETYLHETAGLAHLRARRRADFVIIESGANEDPWPHARLRRVGVHRWRLEMAKHTGRWETTPLELSTMNSMTRVSSTSGSQVATAREREEGTPSLLVWQQQKRTGETESAQALRFARCLDWWREKYSLPGESTATCARSCH